jgi:RNase P/RNase MRP subunit p29
MIFPGSAVRVINSNDAYYYGFEGQVQRVVDGHAAVIFSGGNWEKIVTFRLKELELVGAKKGSKKAK